MTPSLQWAREGALHIPTASNPSPSRHSELMPSPTTECPTRRRSRNSIALSNLQGRRGPGRSRSMSRGAFRLTRPPKRIGRLMSTILASLSCKRLSVSLTGCTSMTHRPSPHPALILLIDTSGGINFPPVASANFQDFLGLHFDTFRQTEWPQTSLFQHPKRRSFAEISGFATLGPITENGRFRIWTLTRRKLLPLCAGAGRPPPTGLNCVVSGNEQPSAGRLLHRAVHARRWPAAILLPG